MAFTRRNFLIGAGLGAPLALAGCGFAPQGAGTDDSSPDTLMFTTWGTDAELAGFQRSIDRFEAANEGKKVALNSVPYEQMFTNIDAQLQAGNPPDVFRVPYYTFGSYAGRAQLLNLSEYLPDGFSDRFTEAAWAAVQSEGSPYGLPHHTDTSAIFYNKDLFDSAGISDVPTELAKAWTWDEFEGVMKTLKAKLPDGKYPFAYNWQGNGVTRWLSWLFEADGRFLAENLTDPAINSEAGRAAVDYTKNFFARKYVPANDTIKSSTYASDSFSSETVAMVSSGAFAIPDNEENLGFAWGATFSPRNKRGASDFGGNALVATAKAKNPELAASFLDFMTGEESMRDFCQSSSLLPTRRDLVEKGIEFKTRPELAPIFIGQASTVRAQDSAQVASPDMSKIISVLQDNLDKAFAGSTSTADTLQAISDGIARATSG